ncbi:hypothetical protein ACM55M_04295 [Flavobacterium sp. ZT3R25]|uniref:hypothetical protein n=1 Tax=Flavobacterium galactosi TaxID=3398735 RepID=UPI003A89A821
MKKTNIQYKTILFVLVFTIATVTEAFCTPPPPPGFEEPSASVTDLCMIPMVIIGIICTFSLGIAFRISFYSKKNRA